MCFGIVKNELRVSIERATYELAAGFDLSAPCANMSVDTDFGSDELAIRLVKGDSRIQVFVDGDELTSFPFGGAACMTPVLENNQKECCICMELELFNPRFVCTACTHQFHVACVRMLVQPICPVCYRSY